LFYCAWPTFICLVNNGRGGGALSLGWGWVLEGTVFLTGRLEIIYRGLRVQAIECSIKVGRTGQYVS